LGFADSEPSTQAQLFSRWADRFETMPSRKGARCARFDGAKLDVTERALLSHGNHTKWQLLFEAFALKSGSQLDQQIRQNYGRYAPFSAFKRHSSSSALWFLGARGPAGST